MITVCMALFLVGIAVLVLGIGGTILIPTPFGRYATFIGLLIIILGALLQILNLC